MGGWKQSGIGFRHGESGIKKYCRTESLVITRFGGKREPTWYPYTKSRRGLVARVAQAFDARDLKRARQTRLAPARPAQGSLVHRAIRAVEGPGPDAAATGQISGARCGATPDSMEVKPLRLMAERDYIAATRERVVVFDGGMGATLEQFDLTQEDYGGLEGKCHEALVLNRPDVIEGVHASMLEAGAEVVETDTFQGSRLKLDEWGLGEHTLEINTQGGGDRPQGGRRGALRRRLDRADRLPARLRPTRPSATSPSARWSRSSPSRRRGLVEGGADLIIIETAQDILEVKAAIFGAREAFAADRPQRCRSRPASRCCPNGGKMLLGTDIQAVLTTLDRARRRRDRAQLLDRARGHARRDPLPRREQPAAGPLHPQRRPAAAGPRRRDDLPGRARAAGGDAGRVRRALRRRHRRRLLRDDARAHRARSASGSAAASPASARRRGRSRSPR